MNYIRRKLISAACAAALALGSSSLPMIGESITSYAAGSSVTYSKYDGSYMYYNGHTYKRFDGYAEWSRSKKLCEARGGHLATITSAGEEKAVEALIGKGARNCYWLGGKISGGKLSWVTNEKVSYTNWAIAQPDNYAGNENALMIYRVNNPSVKTNTAKKWNDAANDGTCNRELFFANNNYGFVCEWDKKYEPFSGSDISKATVTLAYKKTSYTDNSRLPKATVKLGGKTLTKGSDYEVYGAANVLPGKAAVIIEGKGKYYGVKKAEFIIVPEKSVITKAVSTVKNKISLAWERDNSVNGYQIQFSTDPSFKKVYKSVMVKTSTTLRGAVSGFTSGKTYYVRMRAYKIIDDVKKPGAFSAVKSVKVK